MSDVPIRSLLAVGAEQTHDLQRIMHTANGGNYGLWPMACEPCRVGAGLRSEVVGRGKLW
jgi:hypothetical protein